MPTPTQTRSAVEPAGTHPDGQKVKGVRGRDIGYTMLKLLRADRRRFAWSARRWADELNCAVSTIGECQVWREVVRVERASRRAEAIERARCGR